MNDYEHDILDNCKQAVMESCVVLTPSDVMATLNIGKNSVYELLNSGALTGFRIGRSWRVSAEELERFVLQHGRY